jgi:serine phosphatase RsbU (regulator of sigma subunit)
MIETLTLDEVAVLTDAEAVRRQFDLSNARLMGVATALLFVFSVGKFFHALASPNAAPHVMPLAIVHVVFMLLSALMFGELAYADRRRGTWKPHMPVHLMRPNLTAWVVSFLVIEFSLLVSVRSPANEAWITWSMVFPWIVVPLRLTVSRRAAVHISLIVLAILSVQIIGSSTTRITNQVMGMMLLSAITFAIGAFISRRLRIGIVEEWSERRTQAREQLRMRDELRYAREVQLSMLPEGAPVLDWVDLAGTSLPATEVGGDYFDYFEDGKGVALVCGDVAGHGLASGIVLASLRSGFTLLRESLHDPASVLQRLNDLVARTSRTRMLATAAVVLLDRGARKATIASAGHPPVIVFRNGVASVIELFAPPLGVRLPFRVPSREMSFSSGDVFVLHSDGVYESLNPAGESYGLDRLQRLIAAQDGADAAAIRDAIVRDVEAFRAGVAQEDDVTVVVARVV